MTLPLPDTLTPSKLSRFVQCPLSFRYAYVERIAEPPTVPQFLGTLVHRVLQLLFDEHLPHERTPDLAESCVRAAWKEAEEADELAALELSESERAVVLAQARTLIERYFELEDPTSISSIGVELDLRCPMERVEFRGIIDRLDRLPNGSLVVVDYKTGRAPSQQFARSAFTGVQFYAFLCEQLYGERPSEVRLMYLKERIVVVESPTDQTMRGLRQRALAVWGAIERACEGGDFRPNPSRLCSYCSYQSMCPAMRASTERVELATAR